MSTQSNNFDNLFKQWVFDEENSDDSIDYTRNRDDEDLMALLSKDVVIPIAEEDSFQTPAIDFPLPDISIIFSNEENTNSLKMETGTNAFDIPTVVIKSEPEEEIPEQKKEGDDDDDDDDDDDWCPKLVKTTSRKRKINPIVGKFLKESASDTKNGKRVKKLYEQKPFSDPSRERNRLNAINAKKNRDRKKKEKDALSKQMELLRAENAKLKNIIKTKDEILMKHGLLN